MIQHPEKACNARKFDIDDYFDNTTVDDKHLPCEVMDIVDEYDDITYMGITNDTKGEFTMPNVDRNFELIVGNKGYNYYIDTIEEKSNDDYYNYNSNIYVIVNEWCSRKVRLLFDDGG